MNKSEKFIDNDRFISIKDNIIQGNHKQMGIGTLKEKTVHMVLKEYYEADSDYHEVGIDRFVADICRDNKIIEIQTASFDKMRSKLDYFLKEYMVTIVYPIPYIKWINWVDKDTLEVKERRKSPKKGNVSQAFFELYKIKTYLKHPNLNIKLVLMDVEEYRLLNGWSKDKKKGSVRYDRIPLRIEDVIDISEIKDYMQLVPIELSEEFVSKEFAKAAKLTLKKAWYALKLLEYLGIITTTRKKGNAFVYRLLF